MLEYTNNCKVKTDQVDALCFELRFKYFHLQHKIESIEWKVF